MKRLVCLHLVACALCLTPFTTQSAEPPELEKGIAAARAGKIDEAATLLSAAAEKNSDQARWLLARLHGAGKIKGASLQTARKLLEAAAQAGYGPAAYDLARLAEAGALSEGKPDKDETVFYFKGAAQSGLAVASTVWEIMPRWERPALAMTRRRWSGSERSRAEAFALDARGRANARSRGGRRAHTKAGTALVKAAAEAAIRCNE